MNDEIDLDSVLDMTLDDLADMPEFKPYPNGAHKVTFTYEMKEHEYAEDNKSPAVSINYKYLSAIELANPEDGAPKEGDTAGVYYILKNKDKTRNEFAEGGLKLHVAALKERFPAASVKGILDAASGSEIAIVTNLKRDKKNDIDRMNVTAVSVV